ncbi:sodium/proton antiporter (CPA1 family) [Hasllibacter halocynthiae]|uniref:Sodium/proton antiporter (CPA1 family) n=1 Tax=Hasllibacter halocynthiae TaxID=595589 RepID=A0A2T0X4L6_9RHOB|nr:sodium:proton antiporter [Hasllibacter halocynthiae]PRY93804.1 sodium/proton antiporter (CPA1 family) [Hasllibacter halocynthiae]
MTDGVILAMALAVVLFACVSDLGREGRFTAPMMFAGMGLLLGPLGLGLLSINLRDAAVVRVAELTLVVTLFTDAVRIDIRRLRRFHSLPLRLLGIGLPLTMLAGTGAALLLFPGFGIWEAAVLAIILGPTDAALGEPVVDSEDVPRLVRQGLNVESGLNDGLGLPCLLIALALASGMTEMAPDGRPWPIWLAMQIIGGPLVGAGIAFVAARALERPVRKGWVGRDFFRLALLALPIIAYIVAEMVGANGFLSAFASGLVTSTRSDETRDEVDEFGGTVGQLLNSTVFFLVGALFLPEFLHHVGWPHVVFAILALTALRMVPVALAMMGLGLHPSTVTFLGWFGPRGMASVIYLLIVVEHDGIAGFDDIAATVALTVAISIVVHGMTAAPGSKRYGARMKRIGADRVDVPDQRLPGERSGRQSG